MNFTQLIDQALALVRRVFSIGCAAAVFSAMALAAEPIGYGSHGMAVFGGRDGLYASHLPMFHAPHDTQVLLRFHLADRRVDASLRARLALRPQLWTLDPEHFDLHRLQPGHAQPLKQFTARFVQGHFERGGVQRFAQQTVVVDEVLFFKPLVYKPSTDGVVAPSAGRYLLLGSGREFFAVKEIDRRPDFDTIWAMKPLPLSPRPVGAHITTIQTFVLPTNDLQEPKRAALQAALQDQAGATLKVGKSLYFETEDLK